jgi:hypothetical protein
LTKTTSTEEEEEEFFFIEKKKTLFNLIIRHKFYEKNVYKNQNLL